MPELHPPFMNYMGPGTKIEDRLSLNYKGKKGTKNYMIPTTYSDLVSFEHDLLYYSPDNVIKAYADAKFIKDIRSVIGYSGIIAQYMRRLGIEGIYNYGVGVSVLRGIKNIYGDFLNAYKVGKDVKTLTGTLKTLKELDKQNLELMRTKYGDLIRTPAHIQKNIFESQQLTEETRQEVLTNREKFARNVAFRLLPKLIFTGYLVAPKIIKSSKELLRNALTLFVKNPEYDEVQKRVDKVKDKYEKYLNEVGSFEDAPWYRSLVKRLDQPEGEKFFKVKSNYNKDKAKELYIDFFNEFKSYAEFMNNNYKGVEGYEPFNIKELNKANLNKVYDIQDVPSSFIEQLFTKTADKRSGVDEGDKRSGVDEGDKRSGVDEGDKDKYTDEEQNKINELNDEIEKVLKKEQDVLFETPAKQSGVEMPTIEDINFEELYGTIPTPTKAEREKGLPSDEEMIKILEGEQIRAGETPAQIDLPDDFNFEDYF